MRRVRSMAITLPQREIAFDRRRVAGIEIAFGTGDSLPFEDCRYHSIAAGIGPMRRHQCDECRDADRTIDLHAGGPILPINERSASALTASRSRLHRPATAPRR